MFKKVIVKLLGLIICFGFIFLMQNVDFKMIYAIANNIPITISNLERINKEHTLGQFISADLTETTCITGGVKEERTSVSIKLFGFIPLKSTQVVVYDDKIVYLGGIPLGFSITTDGVIVVGTNSVQSQKGNVSSELKFGDLITEIEGKDIYNVEGIKEILKECEGNEISVKYIRGEKENIAKIKPTYDILSKSYKLGVWVRNDAEGIGTLTFVDKNNSFGALGHSIQDFETGIKIPVKTENIYDATLLGITKGTRGKAGELRCLFVENSGSKGDILKNTECGVFGKITNDSKIIDENIKSNVASRLLVKTGNAKLISSVSGIREEYDIEIIKTYNQKKVSDKGFIFRVKDKRLLELTGGIVQGMSGSPIIQDGNLIGAVTYVFLYDSTKGYAVYSDWMLSQVS